MAKDDASGLETAYRDPLRAARNLYAILKGMKAGQRWREIDLPPVMTVFDWSVVELRARGFTVRASEPLPSVIRQVPPAVAKACAINQSARFLNEKNCKAFRPCEAATMSKPCLHGLGWVCEEHPHCAWYGRCELPA